MENIENIENKIATTLQQKGVFSVSDVEKGMSLSRSYIQKKIKVLVQKNILKTNNKKGSGFKYKLSKSNEGVEFFLNKVKQCTIDEMATAWGVSTASAKKYIKKFVDSRVLFRIGQPPKKITYTLTNNQSKHQYSKEERDIIENFFLQITPDGKIYRGLDAFELFVKENYGESFTTQLARKYYNLMNNLYLNQANLNKNKDDQIIFEGTEFIKLKVKIVHLEKLFFQELRQLNIFGKTKLQQLVEITKAGYSNNTLMMEITREIEENIINIIIKYKIDGIGFIPPVVKRKTQLMSFLKNRLNVNLPIITINKKTNLLPVQQKNLIKTKDKQLNAQNTITVQDQRQFKNVLLVDDFFDSGHTLNETAYKIIKQKIAQKVYAFTVTGLLN